MYHILLIIIRFLVMKKRRII